MTLAFICGCAGLDLTEEERRFFAAAAPWGLILFRRNVADPEQVARLTARFRDAVERPEAPVFVDQEGGRVQRLRPPHWTEYPAAAAYGAMTSGHAPAASRLAGRLIAADLRALGITADCAPVLDVPALGSHAVIGDRAFARDVEGVARLGRAFAEGLMAGGVLPVMKHVPGHGRAGVDSHLSLPTVDADLPTLERIDFEPFRRLADLPMAMTAHVVYTALDPEQPATTSRRVIDTIVRGSIGFDGLLLSDDLSMQALNGSLGERAEAAREAGCDVLLHCNGKLDEAQAVAAASRPLAGRPERRAAEALARLARPAPLASDETAAALRSLVA